MPLDSEGGGLTRNGLYGLSVLLPTFLEKDRIDKVHAPGLGPPDSPAGVSPDRLCDEEGGKHAPHFEDDDEEERDKLYQILATRYSQATPKWRMKTDKDPFWHCVYERASELVEESILTSDTRAKTRTGRLISDRSGSRNTR